jgi:ubiquinone biosynthesis monooxygenase Coq6
LTMAKRLQEQCPRYSVAVLDPQGGGSDHAWSPSAVPHPRSYALSPKSLSLIGEDVCSHLRRGEYHSMQIWEANSPAMLVFSNHDLDGNSILGACVEDAALRSALHQKLRPNTVWTNTKLIDFSLHPDNNINNKVELITTCTTPPLPSDAASDPTSNHETKFTTDLLIAADGAQSPIRTKLGLGWKGIDYGRTAVTFTVELASPNKTRAYQRFLPHGPIALLPTYSETHAVVVWSTTPQEAARLKSMDSSELVKVLNDTLQQGPQRLTPLLEREGKTDIVSSVLYGMERVLDTVHYGMGMRHWSDDPEKFMSPPLIASVPTESPRFTFPLTCKLASQYTHSGKVALIGDAAHTVHPMAGQGLNIGLDDVEALTQAIRKSHDSGMEVGQFLQDYEQNRQWSVPQKVGGIHLLHSLFGMRSAPIMHGKSIGMSVINQIGPVRRQLAKIATGLE